MENLAPVSSARLMREVKKLLAAPIEGVEIFPNEANIADIRAAIRGPEGTPFETGVFKMRLVLTPEFPSVPPKGFFTTKIFHPNVSSTGEICVNTLKKDWKPDLGLRHVFMVIRCLLIDPNPESALNEEAGRLLLEDYSHYAKLARMWTDVHAKPRQEVRSALDPGPSRESTKKKSLRRL
eukprot:Plantae.Rhodophyta-Rhodochaete_pulchella.ctg6532.p1 GENE.Plantae.Rhodophyta-Rhodochaete_pulchella.ctg6532~~Plantae.Rhodophyta-Rhodochaete_pulchella.ctg6532.p1  ORF type:complete len:180 (-),score=25.72 Plantae.Rhodophyta-Rhodochaete_pulchella.ctg6532:180-719(-)